MRYLDQELYQSSAIFRYLDQELYQSEVCFIYQQRQDQILHMALEMLLVSHQNQHRHVRLQSKES